MSEFQMETEEVVGWAEESLFQVEVGSESMKVEDNELEEYNPPP